MDSTPVRTKPAPELNRADERFRALSVFVTAGIRHSRIKVLLPEPLTPVTRTSRPRGKRTVRSFRLFLSARARVSQPFDVVSPVGLASVALLGRARLDSFSRVTGRRFPPLG